MTELCKKFKQIIVSYQNGEYGNDDIRLSEILEKAGESNLFKRMNELELRILRDEGFLSRMMYKSALDSLNKRRETERAETEGKIVSQINPVFIELEFGAVWYKSCLNKGDATYVTNEFSKVA